MWKPREASEPAAWEYHVEGVRPINLVATLDRYGAAGWELVDVVSEEFAHSTERDGDFGIERPVLVTTLYRVIFKRPRE